MRHIIPIGCLLLSITLPATAQQVYRWVDDQGITHYTSQPVQGSQKVEKEPVKTQTNVSITTDFVTITSEPEIDPIQEKYDEEARKRAENDAEQMQKYCDGIRKDLANLRNFPRLRWEMPDGSIRRLTDEERPAFIAEREKLINENCAGIK